MSTEERSALLGNEPSVSRRQWGKPADAVDENRQMLAQQQDALDVQDGKLDLIHHSLMNQKEVATAIGVEVDGQKVILDDLDGAVGGVTARMRGATRRVEEVEMSAKNKGLCGLMTALIVALIVVIILAIMF